MSSPATETKASSIALLRPGIGRDVAIALTLLAALGLVLVIGLGRAYGDQAELAGLIDAAGRMRMLSQRVGHVTHRALTDAPRMAGQLPALRDKFAANAAYVEAHGRPLGLFGDGSDSRRALAELRGRWDEFATITSRLLAASDGAPVDAARVEAVEALAETLIAAAEANVQQILPEFESRKHRHARLIPFAGLLTLAVTVGAYLYIRRRVLRPLAQIAELSDRQARGDLAARVESARDDEFGALFARLNANAESMERLRADHARAEGALRDSETRNRKLWEVSNDAIVIIDRESVIRYTNPAVAKLFGHADQALCGQPLSVLQPAHLRAAHLAGFRRYQESGKRMLDWKRIELSALHRDGHELPVELSFANMTIAEEDWFVGFFRDISQRVEAEAELRLRDSAIKATGEGVMISDALAGDHPLLYVNPALERITGYPAEEMIGRNARFLLGNDMDQAGIAALVHLLRNGKEGTVQLRCYRKDGEPFWNELSVAPVRDANGRVNHYISIAKDVSERRRHEDELLHNAQYDALTGLPNRSLLFDRLKQVCLLGDRAASTAGVLFIDLDNFKLVNDTLGHANGDLMLKGVAQRLQACARDGDTLARLGGDEFVLLVRELTDDSNIALVAQRALDLLARPMVIGGTEFVPRASIGGAVFPRDGDSADVLLQRADIAMYRAKEKGRNGFQLYTAEMQTRISQRLTLETELRKALELEEFALYYQPQVALASGRVVGAEALIRWRHPTLGMVSPAQFIPVAEDTGMILPIGQWVIDTACAEAREWAGLGHADTCVCVNLSARQFRQADLVQQLMAALSRHQLRPELLELEITESLAMENPQGTRAILDEAKAAGMRLALDDFGTGYSSLAYLKGFPVDRLKIDKAFIQDPAIVRAVIELARSFRLETVAEGAEDAAVVCLLELLGCDLVQGYYFGKPMPASEFRDFLRANRETPARWRDG